MNLILEIQYDIKSSSWHFTHSWQITTLENSNLEKLFGTPCILNLLINFQQRRRSIQINYLCVFHSS